MAGGAGIATSKSKGACRRAERPLDLFGGLLPRYRESMHSKSYAASARRRAALAAAATALFAAPATTVPRVASAAESRRDETVPSVVLFAGFSFGDSLRFMAGLSGQVSFVTATKRDANCTPEEQVGGGPQLQLVWFGDRDLVVTGGAQAGVASDEAFGLGIRLEAGAAWHLFKAQLGVHTGAHATLGSGELGLRDEWMLELHALGLGLTLPLPENVYGGRAREGTTCVIPGRPLRDATGARVPSGGGSSSYEADDHAARWRADAQAECEAVVSFLRVADALMAAGAPVALVDAALSAAADEIGHALLCAARARDQGSSAAAAHPVLPLVPVGPAAGGEAALIRLAMESLEDGLVNEGDAAAQAAADPRRGDCARADRTLRRIAAEERRHASLGAAIAGWAARTGGDPVRDALSDRIRWLRAG